MKKSKVRASVLGVNVQAVLASAASFACGAAVPVVIASIAPARYLTGWVSAASLIFLASLGVVSARLGGVDPWTAATRVCLWGAGAMLVTAAAGNLLGMSP